MEKTGLVICHRKTSVSQGKFIEMIKVEKKEKIFVDLTVFGGKIVKKFLMEHEENGGLLSCMNFP